jgi:hypothetical protein
MANWYGAARSNYVKIKDLNGLKKALEPFNININEDKGDGFVCFLCDDSSDGAWPSYSEDDEGNELDFNFAEYVVPYMAPDQVLITMESGAEKLRYITGYAEAYHSDGRRVGLSLYDIYALAEKEFGVSHSYISPAEY